MTLRRQLSIAGAALVLVSVPLVAQEAVRLHGVVIDSTRMQPLTGARVYLVPVATGGRLQAVTDSLGRYALPAVPPGTYLVDVRHARRDSLPMDDLLTPLRVVEGGELVLDLGFPSVATLVEARCGAEVAREGGGLVTGVVRRAGEAAVADRGSVRARWTTISVEGGRLSRDTGSVDNPVAADGRYLFCGVPPGAGVALQATEGSDSSGVIDVAMPEGRLVWRDLLVASRTWVTAPVTNAAGDTAMGSVLTGNARLTGVVRDGRGAAVAGAQLRVGVAEARGVTNSSGTFGLSALPGGTHQVEVRALGFVPVRLPVDLRPAEVAQVTIALSRAPVILDTVRVRGERVYTGGPLAGFERRRKGGMGTYLGLDEIEQQLAIFPSDLVFRVPGVFLMGQQIAMRGTDGNLCAPVIIVDGFRVDRGDALMLQALAPVESVVGVEVYRRAGLIPAELPASFDNCGLIAFWTGSKGQRR